MEEKTEWLVQRMASADIHHYQTSVCLPNHAYNYECHHDMQ